MKDSKYVFMVPVPPESVNETVALGTKYSDVRLIKRKWQHLTIAHLQADRPDTIKHKVKVTFKFYFQYERIRDEDNYHLSAKGILDALVEMGVLESDSSEFVKFGGIELLIDKSRPRCEVYVEKINSKTTKELSSN